LVAEMLTRMKVIVGRNLGLPKLKHGLNTDRRVFEEVVRVFRYFHSRETINLVKGSWWELLQTIDIIFFNSYNYEHNITN
jgi:hypothetical protein